MVVFKAAVHNMSRRLNQICHSDFADGTNASELGGRNETDIIIC